jgi:tRNA nucleotidyltransferase (CCA-adding enzyme)
MLPLRLDALPRHLARSVSRARSLARERRTPLYIAGGAVRDLFLGRRVVDVDLVVETEAAGFARELARRLGAAWKLHGRFGTAVLELPEGGRIDLATARAEDYEHAGALPRVRAGSIEDDLARRDFTINAMAVEISSARALRLLDSFAGRNDLRRRLVRMMDPRSPFDDPTRAFRAVRYANRLGFRIERRTREWIRTAVRDGVVDAVSGDRLRREVALLFSETDRAAAVRRMERLGLAAAIYPDLRFDADVARRLRAAERIAGQNELRASWLLYLLAWMGGPTEETARAVAARMNLPGRAARVVRAWPRTWPALAMAYRDSPSKLAAKLETLSDDELIAAAAMLPPEGRRKVLAARRALPGLRLRIRGTDLVAAGVPPGPAIGRALSATLSARRDGWIRPDEELEFALEAARS